MSRVPPGWGWWVAPETEEESVNDNYEGDSLIWNGDRIISGSKIQHQSIWEYVPFNSIDRNDPKAHKLLSSLRKLAASRPLDLNTLVKDHLQDVKQLYREVMKNNNDNLYSLVVISRPVAGIIPQPCPRLAHCVYFGDFDYNQKNRPWDRFNHIVNYAEIGTVQVPHHGAKGIWCHEMRVGDPRHYIVSSGSTNRYHHPSYWVVRDIWDGGHRPFVVSEKLTSVIEYVFDI